MEVENVENWKTGKWKWRKAEKPKTFDCTGGGHFSAISNLFF